MSIRRERTTEQVAFDSIPEYIKKEISPETVKNFADAINDTMSLPSSSELTYGGDHRMFGPISPYNNYLGSGYFNSSDIPLNVLDLMRRDSQVALGMAIVKFPITQLNFTVNTKSPMIKEFIKKVLKDQWATIVNNSLKALDFGFIAFEKVWERSTITLDPGINQRKIKNRDFIVLKKLKPIHPSTVKVRVDDKGNFSGLNQNINGRKIELPRNKSMMITNDEEFGNFFGKSRMVAAYEAWYWKQISTQFFLRYTERNSIPPYKVFYPAGISRFSDGSQLDNSAIAMKMATAISSYGNIAIPSKSDDNGNKLWDVEAINQGRLNIKPNDIVGFWDLQVLRGLLIPDKTTLSAMDQDTASQVYLSTLAAIVKQIEEKINNEVIKPLISWNFSEEEKEECTLNIDDIDFKKREETRKLMSKILDLSATYVKNVGGLPFDVFPDMTKILDILDIPQKKVNIFIPDTLDAEGNKINPRDMNPKGPEKGETTEGNMARTGRDGEPRDMDKQDDQI